MAETFSDAKDTSRKRQLETLSVTGLSNELQRINREIYETEQTIQGAPTDSKRFRDAGKKLSSLRLEKQDIQARIAKAREPKAKRVDAVAAEEQYQREVALGRQPVPRYGADGKSLVPGTDAYFQGSTERPEVPRVPKSQVEEDGAFLGQGTPDKPLLRNNVPFSGSHKGKTYKDGILVKETSETAAAGAAESKVKVGGRDNKQLWLSYLRTTFAELDDKAQRNQIDRLFNTAVNQQWDEQTFMEALRGTNWWQSTLPSLRMFFIETNDPRNASTFAEKLRNNIDSVASKLEALGISVKGFDDTTGKIVDNSQFLEGIAMESIRNNWDDDQLESYLATKGNLIFTGGGVIGGYLDRIKKTAYNYGISLDANLENTINMSLLDAMDGRDYQYWDNSIKQMALDAPQNKPFQESLKTGRSLYEVTNNYRQQMAQLLEIDSTAITWNDLMGKVIDKDTGNARTFADFSKQLKQDPMWQYTKNAKETYSNMALDIAKMFGFAG